MPALSTVSSSKNGGGFFEPVGRHKIKPASSIFAPSTFRRSNEHWLHVSPELARVFDKLPNEAAPETTIEIVTLRKKAFDREIEAHLPPKHSLESYALAALLQAQRNGERGPLLTGTNESVLAYVGGLPVQIKPQDYRIKGHQRALWSVADWTYDGEAWPDGTRIIYQV